MGLTPDTSFSPFRARHAGWTHVQDEDRFIAYWIKVLAAVTSAVKPWAISWTGHGRPIGTPARSRSTFPPMTVKKSPSSGLFPQGSNTRLADAERLQTLHSGVTADPLPTASMPLDEMAEMEASSCHSASSGMTSGSHRTLRTFSPVPSGQVLIHWVRGQQRLCERCRAAADSRRSSRRSRSLSSSA